MMKNEKGTKENPIYNSAEWKDIVMNTFIHDCDLWFIDSGNIKAYLDVFAEMKKRNIKVKVVGEDE